MKAKCCRSMPRCRSCPVRVMAVARRDRETSDTAALISEILGGRPEPPLPSCVTAALDELETARFRRKPLVSADGQPARGQLLT